MELLRELDFDTVDMRANYDAPPTSRGVARALSEPAVNGSTGIAVGMATNIPPHNLRELTSALIALADNRDIDHVQLMKHIDGPDFPTGGQLLNSKVELRQIYKDGQGTLRVRGEYRLEDKKKGGTDIIITSIPYAMTKADLVEKIADVIRERKLPYLLDIRDESTSDVRIVLEIKKDADPELVMAYLYKHTPLQSNFHVNLTCLVPPSYLDDELGRKLPPDAARSPAGSGSRRPSGTSSTSGSTSPSAGSSTSSPCSSAGSTSSKASSRSSMRSTSSSRSSAPATARKTRPARSSSGSSSTTSRPTPSSSSSCTSSRSSRST